MTGMANHSFGCACKHHADRAWKRPEHWTRQEVDLLESSFGLLNDGTIATKLGRTVVGIRIKAKRLGLHKRDSGLTAREVGRQLGIPDAKVVASWVDRGLIPTARRGYRVGNRRVWRFSDAAIEAFIREHGQYIDYARVPADSLFHDLAAAHPWISLVEVRLRTGRPPHNVVTDEIAQGTVRAARRGAHWYIRLEDLPLVRPLDREGIADATFRRESNLERRRNDRKLGGHALTPIEVRARDRRAKVNRMQEAPLRSIERAKKARPAYRFRVPSSAFSSSNHDSRKLTERQLRIVLAIVENGTIEAAAAACGISGQTVKNHVSECLRRTGAKTFTHLVVLLWPVLGAHYRLPGDPPPRIEASA